MGYREMTREECMIFLRQVKHVLLRSKSWLDSTHKPIQQAFDMAIEAVLHYNTGRWERNEQRWGDNEWRCNQCGAVLEGDEYKWRNNYFCYHCGAKMEMK